MKCKYLHHRNAPGKPAFIWILMTNLRKLKPSNTYRLAQLVQYSELLSKPVLCPGCYIHSSLSVQFLPLDYKHKK